MLARRTPSETGLVTELRRCLPRRGSRPSTSRRSTRPASTASSRTTSARCSLARCSWRCTPRPAGTRSMRSRSSGRSSGPGVRSRRAAAARAGVAPRPRARAAAGASAGEPRLPPRRHGTRAADGRGHGSGLGSREAGRVWRPRSRRASSSSTASASASRIRSSPRARTRRPIPIAAARSTRGSPSCSRIPRRAAGSSLRRSGAGRGRRARAGGRGGPRASARRAAAGGAAARSCERADARPIAPAKLRRRAIDAAYLHFESGDSPRAEVAAPDVIAQLPAGPPTGAGTGRARPRPALRGVADEAHELFLQADRRGRGRPEHARPLRTRE